MSALTPVKKGKAMPQIESKLNPRSEDFKANAAAMQAVVDDLRDKVAKIALGGGEAASAKHVARGKLLPRDRVQMLLDPGTPFLELSQMAAYGMYDERRTRRPASSPASAAWPARSA
jgi:3-methylcrotonyl-CoA carboxylase beta subunit